MIAPALLLPLRFVDTSNINDSFDGDFANNQIEDWQIGGKCYLQKYQRSDKLTLQIISDTPLSDLKVYNEFKELVTSITWAPSSLTLIGFPDYVIYEIDYSLSILNNGIYIFVQDNYESQAIDLRDEQPNTLLLKYKNSENDKDVIFDTGLEFQFRVESWIGNYTPKNNREVYSNQQYSPTQLNSTAHRQFTLYVGFQIGVPEWILDKVNIITQCDEVTYNNVKYQPINDSEFEVQRVDLFPNIGGMIDVEPANRFTKYITGNNPNEETFMPVQKTNKFLEQGADFNIPSLFKFNSILEYVAVYSRSLTDFTLKLGTTLGGDEIGETVLLAGQPTCYLVDYMFLSNTTVYVSGISGADLDFYFIWKQMDELPIPINPSSGGVAALKKGAKILWEGNTVEFNSTWDASTGLGKPNSGWEKWTIAGKNGTVSMDESYPIGIKTNEAGQDYSTLGNSVGTNNKAIEKTNLPAVKIDVPLAGKLAEHYSGSGKLITGTDTPIPGDPVNLKTANLGDGTALDIRPKSVISLYIVKIED